MYPRLGLNPQTVLTGTLFHLFHSSSFPWNASPALSFGIYPVPLWEALLNPTAILCVFSFQAEE